jgi:hypothetical protein
MNERKRESEASFSPARNFTITLQDRVRAAGGPPAYMRRKRTIEDLEESLLRGIRKLAAKLETRERAALLAAAETHLDATEINRLIAIHNRFYPIEANLPMHPRTGALIERGRPWKPLAPITLAELVDRFFADG